MFSKTLGDVNTDKIEMIQLTQTCKEISSDLNYILPPILPPMMFPEIYKNVTSNNSIYVNVTANTSLIAYMEQEVKRYSLTFTRPVVSRKLLYKYILLHEVGHIYFKHSSLAIYYELLKFLKEYYTEVEPTPVPEADATKAFHKLANVAGDLEINSKLYTPEEFQHLCYLLSKQTNRINIGCHPDLMDFPRQLTAKEYIELLVKEMKDKEQSPEKYIEKITAILEATSCNETEASAVDYEEVRDSVVKITITEMAEFFREGGGRSDVSNREEKLLDIIPSKEIVELVNSLFAREYRLELHKDTLYNYNRGKVAYTLPRYKNSLKSALKNICFVVDVSPSMDLDWIKQFIKAVVDRTTLLNHRIITFASDVILDAPISSVRKSFDVDYGTDLVPPLERLCNENISKHTKVIVVSDFDTNGIKYTELLNKLPNVLCVNTITSRIDFFKKIQYRLKKNIQSITITDCEHYK